MLSVRPKGTYFNEILLEFKSFLWLVYCMSIAGHITVGQVDKQNLCQILFNKYAPVWFCYHVTLIKEEKAETPEKEVPPKMREKPRKEEARTEVDAKVPSAASSIPTPPEKDGQRISGKKEEVETSGVSEEDTQEVYASEAEVEEGAEVENVLEVFVFDQPCGQDCTH